MTLDALRGKGAYRCGCGVRIKVEVPPPSTDRCAWNKAGSRCTNIVTVNAAESVALCLAHQAEWRTQWFPEESKGQRYNRLGIICDCDYAKMDESQDLPWYIAMRMRADGASTEDIDRAVYEAWLRRRVHAPVVYYVRIGQHIKIGTSTNLKKRLAAYPLGELLATEPGSYDIESQRLSQFAHLLAHRREYFTPATDLLEHIAALPLHEDHNAA
jgi:hypothetical protein